MIIENQAMKKILLTGMLLVLFVGTQTGCGLIYDEEKLLASATQYQKNGDHNSAVIEFKKILQKNPESKQARLLIADSYLVLQKGDIAEKELRRAIKLGAKHDDVVVKLARSLLLQNKIDEIFTEAPLSSGLNPEQKARLQLTYGYAYFARQEVDKAQAMFEKAVENNATAVSAYIGLSKLATATTNLDKALVDISKAINLDNNNGEAWYQRGNINLTMGNTSEAKRSFANVIKVSPKDMMSNQEFQARLKLTQIGLSGQDLTAAKEQVAVMTKHAPNNHNTRYMSAMIAYTEKDYVKARSYLEQLVTNMPDFLQAQLLMGAIYYAQGHLEQANEILSRYVTKVPTHIQARKLLASVRIKSGRHEDALDTLKQAGNPEQDADLMLMIGRAAIMSNDPQQGLTFLKKASKSDPENLLLREEIAKLYMQQGSFDDAIKELEGISGNKKQQSSKNRLLVLAHIRKQDFKQARKLVKQILKEEKQTSANLALAGFVELMAGDRVAAKAQYNRSLAMDESYVPAILSLARMDLEDNNLIAAEQRFKKVITLDDKNVAAMMGLADLSGKNNKPEEAVTWLTTASQKNPKDIRPRIILSRYYLATKKPAKAISLLEQAEKSVPKNQTVLVMLIRAKLSTGQKEAALVTANKLVKHWPKHPGSYIELARIQEVLGYKSKSVKSLNKALDIKSDFLPASIALASLHIKHGRYKEASKTISSIKKSQPDKAIGFSLEGEMALRQKQFTNATKAFSQAMKKQPASEFARKLSLSYRLSGKNNDAIKVLKDWLKTKPEDRVARFDLALTYEKAKQTKNAIDVYLGILKESKENIAALNNLSLLYLDRDKAKALEYAERAYKVKPDIPAIADTYGWILQQSGKNDEALPIIAKAAAKSQNPSIHYHHAVALEKKGDKAGAKLVLDKVFSKNSDFPEKSSARALLDTVSK